MNFKLFNENYYNIEILFNYINEYYNKIKKYYVDLETNKNYEIENFNFENFLQEAILISNKYKLKNLISIIKNPISNKSKKILSHLNYLYNFIRKENNYEYTKDLRNFQKKFWIYYDVLNQNKVKDDENIDEYIEKYIIESKENMIKIKNSIEYSIEKIDAWNKTKIIIIPLCPHSDDIELKSILNAEIKLTDDKYGPSFIYFTNEKGQVEIDDILEGGDTDFFHSPVVQSDYFNLINSILNKNTKEKLLTLYSARPRKDRNYILLNGLPLNIFLCNDYDHTNGLSRDLSSSEPRDIWKIKISSKYLVKTLDGKISYYQLIKIPEKNKIKIELFNYE